MFMLIKFNFKLQKEELLKTIATNIKLSRNPFLRVVPLFIKKKVVELAYKERRKYNTTTLSSIGRIGFLAEYKNYIDKVYFLIAPETVEKIKCTACTVDNTIIFTITSVMENTNVETNIKQFLEENDIKVQIEGNDV